MSPPMPRQRRHLQDRRRVQTPLNRREATRCDVALTRTECGTGSNPQSGRRFARLIRANYSFLYSESADRTVSRSRSPLDPLRSVAPPLPPLAPDLSLHRGHLSPPFPPSSFCLSVISHPVPLCNSKITQTIPQVPGPNRPPPLIRYHISGFHTRAKTADGAAPSFWNDHGSRVGPLATVTNSSDLQLPHMRPHLVPQTSLTCRHAHCSSHDHIFDEGFIRKRLWAHVFTPAPKTTARDIEGTKYKRP
ncbi:hypothetical protein SKAU_G00023690 [Synaphobranchus kaupii]|uniref:Uncharacterized protein n=1 Tax=Synaphobranchus kaupii TaxID=118154 RepID=A0A9Q1GDL1_SYNKA|nr:hypothetical protein SKAU_G00023690 [Synaphobranchus kaupii]